MVAGLNVRVLADDVTVATFQQVLFVHFRRETPERCADAIQKALDAIATPERKAAFFGVIEVESSPPDAKARERFTSFFEANGDKIACAIVTFRGDGFRAAMVRTIVAGIMMLPRRFKFPRHVVATTEEAATLAHRYLRDLDTAATLKAFAELSAMRP